MTLTSEALAAEICPGTPLDLGIVRAVKVLRDAGIHTFESCDGSEGHSYAAPTVKFYGSVAEGWRALAICMDHGLPVVTLERSWDIDDGEPSGPYWTVVFRTTT
jgi:hypothetical protein